MSVQYKVVVVCDGCGKRHEADVKYASAARQQVEKTGWKKHGEQQDLCPACAAKFEAHTLKFVRTVRRGEFVVNGGNAFRAVQGFTVPYLVAVHVDGKLR